MHASLSRGVKEAKGCLVTAGFPASKIDILIVDAGDLRSVVLDIAKKNGIECIVVGTRGHGPLERFVLGSLSTYLVHEAQCAVVVAR